MHYDVIVKHLSDLRKELAKIHTQYIFEKQAIGEATGLLMLLEAIISTKTFKEMVN